MTDAFAEFGVERRPWLDPALLQSRYHELAVIRHPDKLGGDSLPLARLNEARRILSSPPLRLRHPPAEQRLLRLPRLPRLPRLLRPTR